MTKINDGGPVFPVLDNCGHGLALRQSGMSMRDCVAMHVLAHMPISTTASDETVKACAQASFRISDAFLAARSGGQNNE